MLSCFEFFFQAEDGIRDLVRSRGLGDVYKRQAQQQRENTYPAHKAAEAPGALKVKAHEQKPQCQPCLLYTSDAADERSSVDLGGRRIIKKKQNVHTNTRHATQYESTALKSHTNILTKT